MHMLKLPGLRRTRKKMNMRLHDLAGITGVAASTISDIENGKRLARWHTAEMLAGGLGVSVRELTGMVSSNPSRAERGAMSEEAEDFLQKAALWDDYTLRFAFSALRDEMARRHISVRSTSSDCLDTSLPSEARGLTT